MNYAVIGATGNTGKQVVDELLKQGKDVRAIGRTAAKLAPLAKQGAKVYAGSMPKRTDGNTTPTTMEAFPAVFAKAFQA